MNDTHVRPCGQTHFYATEPSVVRGVRRRIRHQVLAAQFAFYLAKIVQQIIRPVREVSPPARLFAHPPEHVFAHAFKPEAVAYAYRELKLVVEPGGAVGLAALLAGRIDAKGKNVVIVLSGGNVDADLFARLVA